MNLKTNSTESARTLGLFGEKTDYIMKGSDNMKYYIAFKEEWKHATINDRVIWVCLYGCMLAFGASAAYSICTMLF